MRRVWLVLLFVWLALTNLAHARNAVGYTRGHKTRIKLVEVAGVELETKTAKAFRRMAKAAEQAGVFLGIRSGFRSHDQQKELYARFRQGFGNLAARPGYSNHQNGRAVDIYIDDHAIYEWLAEHAHRFGFKRTVANEAWHWEYKPPARLARRVAAATRK